MTATKKTIKLRLSENDLVDGCRECVHFGDYEADWLGSTERTIRNFLAGGDYSEGGSERHVEVSIGGVVHGIYTAPQIRRFRHRAGTK